MAKSANRGKGSNLFSLEHDAIRAILAEANAGLLARAESLAGALDRMPAVLDSDELVERARRFRAQAAAAAEELRQARLNDGKPFRDADGVVKAFFIDAEARMAGIEREVRRRLTEAALRAEPPAEPPRAPGPPASAAGACGTLPEEADAPNAAAPSAVQAAAAIPLRWEVAGFDRARLDVEALRIFLTDAALLAACRKHLEENGPHRLDGATYRQVAIG